MKEILLVSLFILSQPSFAGTVKCDDQASTVALNAHKEKHSSICVNGCDVIKVVYKGRVKDRVNINGETLLRTTGIKKYQVTVSDEVENQVWAVRMDSDNGCKVAANPVAL